MNHLLIGNHPSIRKIRELVTMVSNMALNVLLLGETGTGKDVVARLLHNSSSRRKKRFVKVNCAALPHTLLESELFGYEKGAFTGADKLKIGRFEMASGGVIFLDEIGDMPLILQSKLLNVLQSGEFNRLGGTKNVKADSWVISSTNHDLDKDIKSGLFREDLYYRLNIIRIEMPPLRERKEDIPLLSEYFIRKNQIELQIDRPFTLNSGLKDLFQIYHWPGNVRELSSIILRLMMGDMPEKIITEFANNMEEDDPSVSHEIITSSFNVQGKSRNKSAEDDPLKPLKEIKSEASKYIEKKAILHILQMTDWNKSKAAKMLKISYKTLFSKIHDLGITRNPYTD